MRPVAATPVLVALACMLPVSAWWMLELLESGQHLARVGSAVSAEALAALVILRLLGVTLFAPQMTTGVAPGSHSPAPLLDAGLTVALLVLPAWPLLALLALAAGASVTDAVVAESIVVVAACAGVLVSRIVSQRVLTAEAARLSRLSAGMMLCGAAWLLRHDVLSWSGL